MLLHTILYLAIVASLIWARFRFFTVNRGTARWNALAYDIAVAMQIITTLYHLFYDPVVPTFVYFLSLVGYSLSLGLFWWSISSAKALDFAFSDSVGRIITTGPFAVVRHPFYFSYIVVWSSSTLLFNSLILWITLLYLIAFYYLSARKEERVILDSKYSREYGNYIDAVGMFLPRIMKWLPSSSERSKHKKK